MGYSMGEPWGAVESYADASRVSPGVASGTAKLTAYASSPGPMARVGNTISSFAFVLTDVCAFAPRTTMPSGRRSAIRTYRSGSACADGPSDRSPLTSVCATATARSLSRQCR